MTHGIEAVIHFAALKSVEDSFADPAGYLTVNVGGSFDLFAADGPDRRRPARLFVVVRGVRDAVGSPRP